MEKKMVSEQKVTNNSSDEKSNDYYEQVKKMIDSWPDWKKEIHQKLVRLTT